MTITTPTQTTKTMIIAPKTQVPKTMIIAPQTQTPKTMIISPQTQTPKTMIIAPKTQASKAMTITTMPTFTNLAPTMTNQTQTLTSLPQTLTNLTPSQQPRTTTIVKKIVTPRNPTEDEKSSRVMIYKASNGVFKYICLICGIVTTEKLQIKSHMDNHTQTRTAPEIVNKKIILVSSTASGINRPFGTTAAIPISQFQLVRSQPSIVIAPNVSITPIKKPSIQTIPITPMVQTSSVSSYGPAEIHLKTEQVIF